MFLMSCIYTIFKKIKKNYIQWNIRKKTIFLLKLFFFKVYDIKVKIIAK